MATLREIRSKYNEKKYNVTKTIEEECRKELEEKIKELGFDGIVRRKSDGKIGKLRISVHSDSYCDFLRFYPITKKGTESINASGLVWNPEEEFEPFKGD